MSRAEERRMEKYEIKKDRLEKYEIRKRHTLRLRLLLAVIGCMIVLTGCHGREGMEAFTIPEEFDTSKDYEITFWAKNDTNKTQTDIYEKAIADFEALYPNITVNLRLYTDYGKIYNDVITNIATNSDVFDGK